MVTKHIETIGVELEGYWAELDQENGYDPDDPSERQARLSSVFKGDGSVDVHGGDDCGGEGEIASPVYHTMRGVEDFFDLRHPDEVNDTCGMHVHLGFPATLWPLVVREKTFSRFVNHFHSFGSRLRRDNADRGYTRLLNRLEDGECSTFCRPVWSPMSGERYFAFNVTSAQPLGTLEIRTLPMFNSARQGLRAVKSLLNFFDREIDRAIGFAPSATICSFKLEV